MQTMLEQKKIWNVIDNLQAKSIIVTQTRKNEKDNVMAFKIIK